MAADTEPLEVGNKATAHLYIHSPFHSDVPGMKLSGQGSVAFMSSLFATHPPIAERIKRLESM